MTTALFTPDVTDSLSDPLVHLPEYTAYSMAQLGDDEKQQPTPKLQKSMENWCKAGAKISIVNGVVAQCSGTRATAYGAVVVQNGEECEWVVKYRHNGSQCCYRVGVIEKIGELDDYACGGSTQCCFAYFNGTNHTICHKMNATDSDMKTVSQNYPQLNNGGTIKLVLNTIKRTLSFYVNGAKDPNYTLSNMPQLKNDTDEMGWRLFCHLDTNGLLCSVLLLFMFELHTVQYIAIVIYVYCCCSL